MKKKLKQSLENVNGLKKESEKLFARQKHLLSSDLMKKNIAGELVGAEVSDSFHKIKAEMKEKGAPSPKTIWSIIKAFAKRISQLPSIVAKMATVLPTIALIFQTFFLGNKTNRLQDQSIQLLQQGVDFQNELGALGRQTLSLKESFQKNISLFAKDSLASKPPTIAEEKEAQNNRKEMITSIKQRVRTELSASSNPEKKLSEELKGSIIRLTNYCRPYQLLCPNLSPERAYLFDFLLKEGVDSVDCQEIFREGNFQYADFSGKKLDHLDLSEINFQYASFAKSAVTNCNLRGAKLNKANLEACSFWNSDLQDADLREASLKEAKVRKAKLKNTRLKNSNITNLAFNADTDFEGVKLEGAVSYNLEGTKKLLERAKLDSLYTIKAEAFEAANVFERFLIVASVK